MPWASSDRRLTRTSWPAALRAAFAACSHRLRSGQARLDPVPGAVGQPQHAPLPLGKAVAADIEYEGRALITDELVESMKISLPLLQNGITAISFFVRELEAACRVQSTHIVLAPLLQTFLGEMLFGEKVSLVDQRLTARLSDQDVREHIRAVFIPLIRERTVKTEKRRVKGAPQSLRLWKPFQATLRKQAC